MPSYYKEGVKTSRGHVIDQVRAEANNFLEKTVRASGKASRSPMAQLKRIRNLYELEEIFILKAASRSKYKIGRGFEAAHLDRFVRGKRGLNTFQGSYGNR